VREKDRAAVFQIKALAAVGVLEEAFHFPGARNQLIDFGYSCGARRAVRNHP
jgi:hypothetical protein